MFRFKTHITLGLLTLCAATPLLALKSKPGRLLSPLALRAPECEARPRFLENRGHEIPGGLAALPKAVLVARDAEMWIESKTDKDFRVHTFQSFMKPRARSHGRVLCGTMPENISDRFSMLAPTLIDTKDSRVGNSMWQFQVIAQQNQFSVWNKKSAALSQTSSVEDTLKRLSVDYRLYQISPQQYEIVIRKDVQDRVQMLSVRYEVL